MKLCRVRQLDNGNQRRRLAGARRPLPDADADALRQVGSAEFAKAKSLVANVVNDEDDLSERS